MEFKDRLKKYRTDNNLTQEELAEKLFVSRQAISKYETGRSYPSFEVMTSVANLMGVSIDELISQEELAKETINTAEQTRKNKRSLFILLGVSVGVVIISVAAIVLSLLNTWHTESIEPYGEKFELVGMVASTEIGTPTVQDLKDDKLAGYCFLYDEDTGMQIGSAYNPSSTVYVSVTETSKNIEMTLMLFSVQRSLYFYEIYYDGETAEYFFELSDMLDNLKLLNKYTVEIEHDDLTWKFEFNITLVDELLEMKIYEFGLNGEKLSETVYGYEDEYTISPDCLYLVVEEKLKDAEGHEYYNREVIYNSEIAKVYYYPLKLIAENGFGSDSLFIYKY